MHAKVESVLGKLKDSVKVVRSKSTSVLDWVTIQATTVVRRIKSRKQTTTMGLKPLYPLKKAPEHLMYVEALEEALRDDDIRNIALTGSYGSGKSSVLKDFTSDKQNRAVWISFSTLGADIKKYTNQEPSEDGKNKLESKANLIQKEIVKQILYREEYSKVPSSRYPKIYKVTFVGTLFWALAATIILPALLFGSGRLKILSLDALQSAVMMAVVFILAFIVARLLLNLASRVQLQKLSGGPVSIALSASNNYFDQYLDEIIYFFEATKYDVVILEDIDRFDDLYIFENLRQLNNLLNNSKQIGKRIRFIYAVKDSIFHEEKESDGNRTKFFDLIIPTVPFITHRNSRDMIASMFNDTYGLDKNVIALTSKHVTDMRLLKNIYNEFKIFHQKIIQEGKIRDLSTNNLFAMLVYKNIYLKDFEQIRIGDSVLDEAYAASRAYIQERYGSLSQNVTELKGKINTFNDITARCVSYGLKLTAHMNSLLEDNNGYLVSYTVGGESYERSDLMQSRDFWDNVTKLGKDEYIQVIYHVKSSPYGGNATLTIPKSSLKSIIDTDPDVDIWKEQDIQPLQERLARVEMEMDAVRGKSIQQLIRDYPLFAKTIRDLLANTDNDLVYDLLASGYIDGNYGLYTSIYREENVSAAGMNFIVRNLQSSNKDHTYKFSGDDEVRNMLNDLDDIYFENRSIYNFDIVDFLLREKDKRVDKIVRMISEGTPEDIEFLNAFIENGGEVDLLVIELSKIWSGIFNYLVSNGSLNQADKNSHLGTAFMNANTDLKFEASSELIAYLEERAGNIGVIDATSKPMISRIIKLLSQFRVEINQINKIKSKGMLEAIEASNLYAINANNVSLLIANKNLSLTSIKKANQHMFERLGAHLDQYITMIEKDSATTNSVESSEDFVEVLKLSTAQSTDVLSIFVEMASDDCFVDDINEVDAAIWPVLFANFRVFNTLANAIDYYVHQDQKIDGHLEDFLEEVEELVDNETIDDQAQKKSFALSVLDSGVKTSTKANIVKSLGLSEFLKVGEFKGQNGELYGLLVEAGVIEDTAATFNNLVNMSWPTKEQFILKSSGFQGYIADVKFSSDVINGIAASLEVSPELKAYFINNAVTYKELFSPSAATFFAQHAIRNNLTVDAGNLTVLLDGPDTATRIELIHLSLPNLARDDLLDLLATVGGEYAKFGQPNKHPKIDDNAHNHAIVERLQSLGVVNSFDVKKDKIKANIKSGW